MPVFVCLALSSIPALDGAGPDPVVNVAVQLSALCLLWVMVTKKMPFRWIPR